MSQVTIPSQWVSHICTGYHVAHAGTRKEGSATMDVAEEYVETNGAQGAALVPERGFAFELWNTPKPWERNHF